MATPGRPFDPHADYLDYVDGKPRREGVRSFLAARGIKLVRTEEADLAARKDRHFECLLKEHGIQTFASTLDLIRALREQGVKTGVVTSSRHGREILHAAGLESLFDTVLDGNDLETLALKGKPDPDMYLHAAQSLGALPAKAAVFEDAAAGVTAGRRGGFGLVVGVDRGGNAGALKQGGADVVVEDLAELGGGKLEAAWRARQDEFAWRIEQQGFELARERQMESLFCVGNGYLGVRGALDTPLPGSQPDMFIAGIYDRKCAELPYSEIEFLAPERGADLYAELVPLPFPFRLALSVEGEPANFSGSYGRELRRILDMRVGLLRIEAVFETPGGRRTALRTRRCASLADPHLLLQEATATAQNHWGKVEMSASLDVPELAAAHPHLQCIEHAQQDGMELVSYRDACLRVADLHRFTRAPGIRHPAPHAVRIYQPRRPRSARSRTRACAIAAMACLRKPLRRQRGANGPGSGRRRISACRATRPWSRRCASAVTTCACRWAMTSAYPPARAPCPAAPMKDTFSGIRKSSCCRSTCTWSLPGRASC